MHRKAQHVWIVKKDLFGAIAVVNVIVDNEDAFDAKMMPCILGGQRHIVEDAKAAGQAGFCMMTGRPNECESIVEVALHDLSHQFTKRGSRLFSCDQRVRRQIHRWILVGFFFSLTGAARVACFLYPVS